MLTRSVESTDLCLAKIRNCLGTAIQHFMGQATVVIGLDIGRIELDRLCEIINRAAAVALRDKGLAARIERTEVFGG